MESFVYDGSFDGWLTTVFEIYEHGFTDVNISVKKNLQPAIFGGVHEVITDEIKSIRLIKGLQKKISGQAIRQLYSALLSEIPGIENVMLQYVQNVFRSKHNPEKDYSNASVLYIQQTAKKVHREKHRMEAFTRFQLTKDDLYFAVCEPDFNVLPLIRDHFEKRYADQRWMIYDLRRNFGLHYDLNEVSMIEMNFSPEHEGGRNITSIQSTDETVYQELWKHYFKSVNIVARKNMKLHIQHMPKRYWKFLTEKMIS